jgi:alcohol dehydrogenase class IV
LRSSIDLPQTSLFTFPTRIQFGEGSRACIPDELARLGVNRPLIVTDQGIRGSGLLDRVLGSSTPAGPIHDAIKPNPNEDGVLAGLELFRSEGCDGLLAVGGGSPLDAAKAIRLLASHPGTLADYDVTTGGADRIGPDLPPMVAVPTTAGTGSEVGRAALIQLPQTGRKTALISQHLIPSVAVCDPELTLGLPPTLTAGTGMDAFTHCLESFLSTTFHPICDGIALEGIRHVAKGLESAVRDGSDRRARRSLMMGALLGGISLHKGLGVVHALSHALAAEGRAHHGTLNAILLPHALRFNMEAAAGPMVELANQLGVGRGMHGPAHLVTLCELVLARLPLPGRLRQVAGLDQARIPEYADLAARDHSCRTNPRPCTHAALEALLEQAW